METHNLRPQEAQMNRTQHSDNDVGGKGELTLTGLIDDVDALLPPGLYSVVLLIYVFT